MCLISLVSPDEIGLNGGLVFTKMHSNLYSGASIHGLSCASHFSPVSFGIGNSKHFILCLFLWHNE